MLFYFIFFGIYEEKTIIRSTFTLYVYTFKKRFDSRRLLEPTRLTVHRLSYISYTAISRQDVSKIHLFCSYFVLILYHELLTTWRGQFVYLRVTVLLDQTCFNKNQLTY